jgi:hypothetical protein
LIDLPGIIRIPLTGSDPPHPNVYLTKITKAIAARYCGDSRTIILCVIPANSDIETSNVLRMARELDPKGLRTLGVITKIDIMDRGTNAKGILTGRYAPLKLGYVGVKNRTQQ